MLEYFKQLGRRKDISHVINETSHLRKVISLLDLTALGVGCTLGVGVYVLPGLVARQTAGPGVVLSFLFAAVASVFAGLCFAEFGARVPRAGSAYIYSYVTVGEFIAFTIGWNLIIEYIIGSASVARGLSVYIDTLVGNQMEAFYRNIYELRNVPLISEYFDLFAFGISLLVAIGLAVGLKDSLIINNLLTFVNVSVVIFVIVVGSFKVDFHNWNLSKTEIPPWGGEGGFLPFGIMGAIRGAATCFYGYVGFDVISTSGEEVSDPQRTIPLAIILSLTIIFFAYFGLSSILTLMWPYFAQDIDSPIPYAFAMVGWDWAAWIVAIGGIFGLLASLFSGMFSLPRIIYSMANDGLMFSWLGTVSPRFGTPFNGTLIAGLITAFMAAAFQLKQLIDLMSIATLLAYTIVAACVLLLRYKDDQRKTKDVISHEYIEHAHLISKEIRITCCSIIGQMFSYQNSVMVPTKITSAVAITQTILYSIFSLLLAYVLTKYESSIMRGNVWPCALSILLSILMILSIISLYCQPSDTSNLKFKVPLVPLIPCISIFFNIYLMMMMDYHTWLRFIVWMIAGYIIYFTYGMFHSLERRSPDKIEYEVIKGDDKDDVCL
ncbi:hypothetical protein O3M35_012144 [Rhynocoris fuscipes]|uniref:Cationic amino acid transporter C-terminal domain-containing protein n=1 Tax=Rhynocoris fuscipes TaxID=488301 RepID=A0AAW1CXS4_9HEMI